LGRSLRIGFINSSSDDGFYPAGQLAAGQQDAPLAAAAFQTDICTQPHYFPFIPATGMRLSQADYVSNVQIWQHFKDYTIP
jgi:hypothetical protein